MDTNHTAIFQFRGPKSHLLFYIWRLPGRLGRRRFRHYDPGQRHFPAGRRGILRQRANPYSPTPPPFGSPTWTPTITPTATPTSWFCCISPSLTPTPNGPTATFTPVPGAQHSPTIADFEAGLPQTSDGGAVTMRLDSAGSTLIIDYPGGCPYGTVIHCCHCQGSVVQDIGNSPQAFCRMELEPGGVPVNIRTWSPGHCLSFSFYYSSGPPPVTFQISLPSQNITDNGYYQCQFTPAGTGWQTFTVYFPDVAIAPGQLQFSQPGWATAVPWSSCASQVSACQIGPVPSAFYSVNYDFQVDDVTFSAPSFGNNPLAVAAALGVPLATVLDAQSLYVDEYLSWIIIRLSVHCGCHPHDIYQLRASMSWGQIAQAYGISWTDILAEVDALVAAGNLDPQDPNQEQISRSLQNNPQLTPQVTPQAYIAVGTEQIPGPSLMCP